MNLKIADFSFTPHCGVGSRNVLPANCKLVMSGLESGLESGGSKVQLEEHLACS